MKVIYQLLKFLESRTFDINLIRSGFRSGSKNQRYFDLIIASESIDEVESINTIFAGDRTNLWRAKKEIKNRLINGIIFSKIPKHSSDRKKAILQLTNYNAVINRLFLGSAPNLAHSLLMEAIKLSIKFEVTEYTFLFSSELIKFYSVYESDHKMFNKYVKLSERSAKVLYFEKLSFKYYYELSLNYYSLNVHENVFKTKLKKFSNHLRRRQNDITSFQFNHKTFSILSTRYLLEKKYQDVLKNVENALNFFERKPYETQLIKFTFYSDKILALIFLGYHELAEQELFKLYEMNLGYFNKSRINYYQYFNYALWENYNFLYGVVFKVLKNKDLSKHAIHKEKWKIREAYVHFLIEAGKIQLVEEEAANYKKFRLGKFMNDVPIYSKEKRGMNISILVVQMLFFIVRKKYDLAIDRIDSLKQYTYRYLRNDDTYRSNCFLKMLTKVPQANFHPFLVRKYTKELEKKLRNHKMDIHVLNNEIEVIPFDDLWEIILEVLAKNRIAA